MTMEVPTGVVLEVRVLTGARAGEQLLFFDAEHVKIGRNPACDVVLPDGAVSRQHAELSRSGEGYTLTDSGSTAGTFVLSTSSSERVTSATVLPPAAEVAFGSTGPRCRIGVGLSVPFGRYRLIGRLGGGGMAEVFMARQTGLGGFNRPVALKLIQPEMFALVDAGAMFLDEARIAAEISHHNVVKIYDVGDQDGVLYLAMEYLRGVTLSQMATQLQQRGERMPPDLVASLLSQACAGLHAAHTLRDASGKSLNVVHRDVSPSNLMCLPEGLVKVIDFGVARADIRLVRKEEGLQGKPAYMSPEQIQGQPLDGRSDVFAAGVVLYELCSGKPLFQRNDTVATFYAVVRSEVPPLSSVCPEATPLLDAVAKRALAKDPNLRYQSAAELAADLDQVVKEAGGRFSSIAATARFLTDWGVSLVGPPPALLTQVPKARLVPRTKLPARIRKRETGDSDDSLESDESFQKAPEATLEPRRTGDAPSLSYEPERLVGKRIERYQVTRYLGRTGPGRMQKRDRALPKLYYQAEAVTIGPGEQAAKNAGLLEDGQVALLLCGQGAALKPFDEAQQARLAELVKKRRPPAGSEHLVAVLDCIHQPDGASIVVMPFVKSTLAALLEAGPVRVEDALDLATALLRALAGAAESQPDFVHGELSPSRIGLLPLTASASGTRVVLLDLNLELVLGMPPLPFQGRATVQNAELPYLSPERWGGEPPTPASDVYAVGAMLYQLFGGDLGRATTCLRARRELPRLPPQRGLLSHVESSIFAALRHEADRRPTAARLLELLRDGQGLLGSTLRGAAARLRIKPTADTATKEPLRLRTPSGQELVLSLLTVRAPKQHTTFALPLGKDVELLPAPLSLLANGETLLIEIDEAAAATSGSFDRSRNRPSLYHDAHEPSSRCDRYTLIPNAATASFDIGHRRTTVQRVNYVSALRPAASPVESLLLPLPDLQIEIEVPGPLLRGVVLYSVAPQSGTAHAVAIALTP